MAAWRSVLVVLALGRGAAFAQPTPADSAQRLFDIGRDLLAKGKFREACDTFEQSQRLDPQWGTRYNIAICKIATGKLATAWNIYLEMARSDPNPDRRARAGELATQIEPRVPKLMITIVNAPPRLRVMLGTTEVTQMSGIPIPMDHGNYVLTATAPGFSDWRESVSIVEERVVVPIKVELVAEAPDPIASPRVPAARSDRIMFGKFAVVGGVALAAGGLLVGGLAWQSWDDAQFCVACDRADKVSKTRLLGDISTVLVAAGLVSGGIGVYLWRTGSTEARLVPSATTPAGATLVGRF